MESLSGIEIFKKLRDKNIKFVDYSTLGKITGHTNKNTIYKLAERLVNKEVLVRVSPGLFLLKDAPISEFEIANYIYQPSYISLESALSFYGIIPQFAYTITSITTRKVKRILVEGKEYSYSKINEGLYWGYEKKSDILIASPEKALLDIMYFASKGISRPDFKEMDLTIIDKDKLLMEAKKFKSGFVLNKAIEITK
ncbi:MAG: hypothetical protein ABIJ36_03335 [Patescibacteria group bacterium]|nr:hypothetical protein [Patescibacteria group bacterium]